MLVATALMSASGDAVDLSSDDFDDAIKSSPFFVKFYSPNCPHCIKIAPIWEKVGTAAPNYPQPFMVGDVDCTKESFLCERFGVRGVPTLIYFREGKMYKYNGAREYNDIMKFGAGDFKKAAEVAEIPPPGGSGVVGQVAYTLHKFVKDLIAIVRFNYWAVILIFLTGFMAGSVVVFTVMLFALSRGQRRAAEEEAEEASEQTDAPKSAQEKKSD